MQSIIVQPRLVQSTFTVVHVKRLKWPGSCISAAATEGAARQSEHTFDWRLGLHPLYLALVARSQLMFVKRPHRSGNNNGTGSSSGNTSSNAEEAKRSTARDQEKPMPLLPP